MTETRRFSEWDCNACCVYNTHSSKPHIHNASKMQRESKQQRKKIYICNNKQQQQPQTASTRKTMKSKINAFSSLCNINAHCNTHDLLLRPFLPLVFLFHFPLFVAIEFELDGLVNFSLSCSTIKFYYYIDAKIIVM